MYVQQQVHDRYKEAVREDYYKDQYPTPEDIKKICLRDKVYLVEGDANDPDLPDVGQNRDMMMLVWNELLPCIAGDTRWGSSKRNYQCLSVAKMNPSVPESAPCVTASDEAFLQVLVENNYPKWIYMYSEEGLNGDQDEIKKARKANDPKLQVKWTNPKAGQVKFGGWLEEGKQAFTNLKAKVKAARKEAHVPELEADVLQRVRKANKQDEVDQKRAKAKKGKKDDLLSGTLHDPDEVIPEDLDDWE